MSYIHKEIMLAILPVYEKYKALDVTMSCIIAEMNHAAWEMSFFNDIGLQRLHQELKDEWAEVSQAMLETLEKVEA